MKPPVIVQFPTVWGPTEPGELRAATDFTNTWTPEESTHAAPWKSIIVSCEYCSIPGA